LPGTNCIWDRYPISLSSYCYHCMYMYFIVCFDLTKLNIIKISTQMFFYGVFFIFIGLSGNRQKVESFPLEYMTVYVKPIYVAQVMFSYIYMYIYKYIYICIYICIYKYICIYLYMYMYTYIYIYKQKHVFVVVLLFLP
jgi:hypothetical protein